MKRFTLLALAGLVGCGTSAVVIPISDVERVQDACWFYDAGGIEAAAASIENVLRNGQPEEVVCTLYTTEQGFDCVERDSDACQCWCVITDEVSDRMFGPD